MSIHIKMIYLEKPSWKRSPIYYAISLQSPQSAVDLSLTIIIYVACYTQLRAILRNYIHIMSLTFAGMVRIMRYYTPFLGYLYAK
jgi:hypothetical protein